MTICIRCDEEITGKICKTDDGDDLCEGCQEKLIDLCNEELTYEQENLIIGDKEYGQLNPKTETDREV